MIGGNIPGETRVVSVQIYDHVEALDYARPTGWQGMIVFSFLILLLLYLTSDKAAVGSLQLAAAERCFFMKPSQSQPADEANFSVKLSEPLRSAGAPRFELVIDELLAARGVTALVLPVAAKPLLRALASCSRSTAECYESRVAWHDQAGSLQAHQRPVGFVFKRQACSSMSVGQLGICKQAGT